MIPQEPIDTLQSKTVHILDFEHSREGYENLISDILFQRELDENQGIETQIYFDTSGVIDMLTGMSGLFRMGKIGWNNYKKPSTLVYALGYKKWLGQIFTLPPHTEELVNQLQSNNNRFPEKPAEKAETLKEQFWAERNLKIHQFKDHLSKRSELQEFVVSLKKDSVDLFKGIYLSNKNCFWKPRYKYLVKDQNILKFSTELDYQLGDITKKPLFSPLLKYLNEKRPDKSSNNYIDAIALCMLDEKLNHFYRSKKQSRELPVFFSDQNHILDAVKEFSKRKDLGIRPPFTYKGLYGDFYIVRNANFFIIEGVMNAIREKNIPETLDEFELALKSLQDWLNKQKSATDNWTSANETQNRITRDFQQRSEEKFFLEFFEGWWTHDGFAELEDVLKDNLSIKDKKSEIEKEVHLYIDEERQRIKNHFSGYQGRISIIRKAWNSFQGLSAYINQNYQDTGQRLNIHKEFGPRFSYTEKVCTAVQNLSNRIFDAGFHNQKDELEEAEAEIVTYLVHGLFGKSEEGEEYDKKLDQLAIGLAILWVFEKYDLIDSVCERIRKLYQLDPSSNDMYPSASIALMHAASLFNGSAKNKKLALRILNCVESKFGNSYKVWISLSYLYYLLWDQTADDFKFPELLPEDQKTRNQTDPYLKKALHYSKMAVDWLEDKRKNTDKENEHKIGYRQRRYYYVLNNYLFFKTLCAPATEFIELEELAEKLEEIHRNTDYWQEDRFPDTLARFFYRLAYLSKTKDEFEDAISEAIRYNNMAMRGALREKNIYLTLQRKLKRMNKRGFESLQAVKS